MTQPHITRRQMLVGMGALGVSLAGLKWLEAEDRQTPELPRAAQEALTKLKAGNLRFVEGKALHPHQDVDKRKLLAEGQNPFATVLGCSDSRVPPEMVFDQGLGDLFVIRVAGNVVSPSEYGSVEFAVTQLKTPLVVVLGHEKCGAVAAALDGMFRMAKAPAGIEALLRLIKPGLKDIDPKLARDRQIVTGVEANVRWSIKQIADSPEGKKALREKRLAIVGGIYELGTGRVRFLGP
jgi:carbonic anhydrase